MEYFNENEFKCKCCGEVLIDGKLASMLDEAREKAGIPFVLTSGYRCPKHNEEVGGVKNSAHSTGLAVDIRVRNSNERLVILKAVLETGFKRVGVYKSFIHIDVDNSKPNGVMWLG